MIRLHLDNSNHADFKELTESLGKELYTLYGDKKPEAIRFYNKFGYIVTDNFGPYVGNTNSICMSKPIV